MAQLISNLPIGSKVKDTSWNWQHRTGNGYTGGGITKPIVWLIVAKNHIGYPINSITLLTDELIAKHIYDNSTDKGSTNGCNHWGNSGIPNATYGIEKFLNGNSYDGEDINSYPITFYDSMSEGFKSAILTTALENKPWDSETIYYTEDKLFLPSQTELGGGSLLTRLIGVDFGYFTDEASRIAYLDGVESNYWTRSPYNKVHLLRTVVSTVGGIWNYYGAKYNTFGVRPVCNAKNTIMVSDVPDTDGAYIIISYGEEPPIDDQPISYIYSNGISLPIYETPSSSRPLLISTPSGIGALELVELIEASASPFRISTPSGVKAIKKI